MLLVKEVRLLHLVELPPAINLMISVPMMIQIQCEQIHIIQLFFGPVIKVNWILFFP